MKNLIIFVTILLFSSRCMPNDSQEPYQLIRFNSKGDTTSIMVFKNEKPRIVIAFLNNERVEKTYYASGRFQLPVKSVSFDKIRNSDIIYNKKTINSYEFIIYGMRQRDTISYRKCVIEEDRLECAFLHYPNDSVVGYQYSLQGSNYDSTVLLSNTRDTISVSSNYYGKSFAINKQYTSDYFGVDTFFYKRNVEHAWICEDSRKKNCFKSVISIIKKPYNRHFLDFRRF